MLLGESKSASPKLSLPEQQPTFSIPKPVPSFSFNPGISFLHSARDSPHGDGCLYDTSSKDILMKLG
jgi:hypothetical protein